MKHIISVSAPKCVVCTKSVYEMEKVLAIDQIWHKSCFTCGAKGTEGGCKKVLTLDKYLDHCGEPFCKTCHGKLFGPKGYGYGVGAGVLCPSDPLPSTERSSLASDNTQSSKDEKEVSSSKKMKYDSFEPQTPSSMDISSSQINESPRAMNISVTPRTVSPRPSAMETLDEDDDDENIPIVDEDVSERNIDIESDKNTTDNAFISNNSVIDNFSQKLDPTEASASDVPEVIATDMCSVVKEGDEEVTSAEISTTPIISSKNNDEKTASVLKENNPPVPPSNVILATAPYDSPRPFSSIENIIKSPLPEYISSIPIARAGTPGRGVSPARDLSTILGLNKQNSGVKAKLGEGAPKCALCQKSVYPAEKVQAIDQIWHKTCFCCGGNQGNGCKKVLTLQNYLSHATDPFCKPCHGKHFGPKGYGYGTGAGVLSNTGVSVSAVPAK